MRSAPSATCQIVAEIYQTWAPEVFAKAEKDPGSKLDGVVLGFFPGVKPQIVKAAQVQGDKIWSLLRVPKEALHGFYKKSRVGGVFSRPFVMKDQARTGDEMIVNFASGMVLPEAVRQAAAVDGHAAAIVENKLYKVRGLPDQLDRAEVADRLREEPDLSRQRMAWWGRRGPTGGRCHVGAGRGRAVRCAFPRRRVVFVYRVSGNCKVSCLASANLCM